MSERHTNSQTLFTITTAVILVIAITWVLVIGQAIIIPIFVSLISVYVLGALDSKLASWPVTRFLPSIGRRLVLVLLFLGSLAALTGLVISTIQQLGTEAPKYQQNIESLITTVATAFGASHVPDWDSIQASLTKGIDLTALGTQAASSLGSIAGTTMLIAIYVIFLFSEKAGFSRKLSAAFPDQERTERTRRLVGEINERIGQYLGTKTLINVILALLSYVVLLIFGVDYAAFWALLIGLLNYIPYIGSVIAVLFPVLLSLLQFGSLSWTIWLLVVLTIIQTIMGNIVEPRMVGRRVNLSAFVVLVALSVWSAMWGIMGAILAVPLTSMMTIIFAEIPATRPLAVLMSEDVLAMQSRFISALRRKR